MSSPLASKIARILPRLGSNHDGEVIASARAIERTLQSAGLDWNDFARSVTGGAIALSTPSGHERPRAEEPAPLWSELDPDERLAWLEAMLAENWLSHWERDFAGNIKRQAASAPPRPASVKQQLVLNRLIGRAFNVGVRP